MNSLQERLQNMRFRQGFANAQDQPRSDYPVTGAINKGGPMQTHKASGKPYPGKDLDTHLRLTAADAEMLHHVCDEDGNPKEQKTMPQILDELYGKEPGTAVERILVRIVNFDKRIAEYRGDLLLGTESGTAKFENAIKAWAIGKAVTKSSSGKLVTVARTDADFGNLIYEDVCGARLNYGVGEVPITEDSVGTTIILNTPQDANELYNEKLDLGILCYVWRGRKERKLVPWVFSGRLEFILVEVDNLMIDNCFVLNSLSSKYNIGRLTDTLVHWATKITKAGLRMSQLEFQLFRTEEEIETVDYKDKGNIGDRGRIKTKHWMVRLEPTHKTMATIRVAEDYLQQQHTLTAGEDVNAILGLPPAPEPKQSESSILYEEEVIEGEEVLDDANITGNEVYGDWLTEENIRAASKQKTGRSMILMMKDSNICGGSTNGIVYEAMQELGISKWSKSRSKRVLYFVMVCLFLEAIQHGMDGNDAKTRSDNLTEDAHIYAMGLTS